jgi:long-chain fatty acid transport protein
MSSNRLNVFLTLIGISISFPAAATNGINLIGFGLESTLMGGADTAVARDTGALNTNPAGLAQIHGRAFDGFGTLLRTTDLAHKDALNDHTRTIVTRF